MTFWNKATQEQKLAQIDGGIECGMNATQVAMNCGTTSIEVTSFANYRHRFFGGGHNIGVKGRLLLKELTQCRRMKANAERFGGPSDAAFSIFDHQPESLELEWPA